MKKMFVMMAAFLLVMGGLAVAQEPEKQEPPKQECPAPEQKPEQKPEQQPEEKADPATSEQPSGDAESQPVKK